MVILKKQFKNSNEKHCITNYVNYRPRITAPLVHLSSLTKADVGIDVAWKLKGTNGVTTKYFVLHQESVETTQWTDIGRVAN